jgi:hypothetical protein
MRNYMAAVVRIIELSARQMTKRFYAVSSRHPGRYPESDQGREQMFKEGHEYGQ